MRIELFEESRDDINVAISAQIEDNGDLSTKGIDSGKLVKELQGDRHFEYNVRVKKMDKEKLIEKLSVQNISMNYDADLLGWLKSTYNHNEVYSNFLNLLKELGIENDTFIWP